MEINCLSRHREVKWGKQKMTVPSSPPFDCETNASRELLDSCGTCLSAQLLPGSVVSPVFPWVLLQHCLCVPAISLATMSLIRLRVDHASVLPPEFTAWRPAVEWQASGTLLPLQHLRDVPLLEKKALNEHPTPTGNLT